MVSINIILLILNNNINMFKRKVDTQLCDPSPKKIKRDLISYNKTIDINLLKLSLIDNNSLENRIDILEENLKNNQEIIEILTSNCKMLENKMNILEKMIEKSDNDTSTYERWHEYIS